MLFVGGALGRMSYVSGLSTAVHFQVLIAFQKK